MTLTAPNVSHEGLSYFLHRAAAMSLEDARHALRREIIRSILYHRAWHSAKAIYLEKVERIPNHNWNQMPHECHIALTCYTHEMPRIVRQMNGWCCRAEPTPLSWALFPYKSLWCFLLRAFEMLPEFSARRVFRVVESMGDTAGNRVLFTEFVSATVSFESASNYAVREGIQQIFNSVPPQLVRNIGLYTTREDNLEVLIWPFCTFKIFQFSPYSFALDFCWETLPRHFPGLLPAWS